MTPATPTQHPQLNLPLLNLPTCVLPTDKQADLVRALVELLIAAAPEVGGGDRGKGGDDEHETHR